MKSIFGTIIVFAVFGLAMASTTLAQEANVEVPPVESVDTTNPVVPIEPAAPPPPPSPPQFSTPTAAEPSVNVVDELMFSAAGQPHFFNLRPGTPARSSSKVLVIPNTEITVEDLAAITQDMQVMSHIFQKIFTGPRLIEGLFMNYGKFFGRESRATQAIYLQGYGTLFLMEVDFPFTPPAESKEKPKDTKEADSVWQQAKQEIFHPSPSRSNRAFESTEIYDAEKVKELKSRLIKALKHAANIRNIKPDEWIILTATGKGQQASMTFLKDMDAAGPGWNLSTTRLRGRRTDGKEVIVTNLSRPVSTVLTIRAKKSDVDAFAKGELDYDKFREKVQILTYPSWGQQVGREVSHHFPSPLALP